MNVIKQLPNIFTLCNLLMGFLSIISSINGQYDMACYYIVISGLFDTIDGKLARIFNATTIFGKQIDSLADIISFCLAPCILIYMLYVNDMVFGQFISFVPLMFGAIRLARFNSAIDGFEKYTNSYFSGLPVPMFAFTTIALIMTSNHSEVVLFVILFLSVLMVSKVEYAKVPSFKLNISKENNIRLFILTISIIFFLMSILFNMEFYVLLCFVIMYIISGFMLRSKK
tara:strand:+ start:461 stop:1144 length:684 start_codon:yes stop_codon:yes gene_type:complete